MQVLTEMLIGWTIIIVMVGLPFVACTIVDRRRGQ